MFIFDKQARKSIAKSIFIVVIVLVLILSVASCKPAVPNDSSTDTDAQQSEAEDVAEKLTEKPIEETEKPMLPKLLVYVSVMGGRDCTLPIEEKGFDYNNFDAIVEFDPNDSTIKIVDMAWLMGMQISEDETIANMMMGDRFGPAALPAEVARILDLEFTHTIVINFTGMLDFFDGMGGVDADISQEVIDDGSYNQSIDNLQYFIPGVPTPDKLDSPGEKTLSGAQVLAMILTTPNRVSKASGGTEGMIRAVNSFIDGMSKMWVIDFTEKLKDLSTDDMVALMKKIAPNMYSSFSEEEYGDIAEILQMCLDNDAQVVRMPDEADGYELEEGEMSWVMVLDIEQARQKLRDFFAD
ncbi:MAG: hypothetical protein HN948_03560 [Clostridia bacterium]|jgi:hypothetical protein|nr:hypothetical protein [Clostridia bacterium]MBT7122070.1 hypothetical protein [Clostridia bacterium]